jgi:hypothetical protein
MNLPAACKVVSFRDVFVGVQSQPPPRFPLKACGNDGLLETRNGFKRNLPELI